MRFLHITDIHYLNEYPKVDSGYLAIFKDMTSPIEQLKEGLKTVDLQTIDAVLITGDLVECGDADDYRQLKLELSTLFGEIPILVTLGNHDSKSEFYKGWLEIESSGQPYHTSTRVGDTTVIGLDISDEQDQNGAILQEHCKWLEKALADAKGTQVLLMIHHHLLLEQATIPSVHYEKEFYQIIQESDVAAILCGHTHHAYQGQFAGKDYFTADNLSFVGIDEMNGTVRFEEYSGFNECYLKSNKLEVKRVPAVTSRKLLAKVKFK